MKLKPTSVLPLLVMLGATQAWALDANQVRGGWETRIDGHARIYNFEIEGLRVTGVSCGDCADGSTLAFIEGALESDQIRFVVNHVRDDGGTAFQDHLSARLEGQQLLISGKLGGRGGRAISLHLHKDPRGPAAFAGVAITAVLPQPSAPAPNVAAYGIGGQLPPAGFKPPRGAFGQAVAYVAPGPWERITSAKLVGVWFAGTGHGKQYFIIRRVGGGLLGMVCGPCDNPYTMGALDHFEIHGDTVRFQIHHEDFGLGALPFHNMITAHLADHELRVVSAIASNLPMQQQPFAHFAFSMIGPVPFDRRPPCHCHRP